jgi:DNA-binding GntR family transcriptional regulator
MRQINPNQPVTEAVLDSLREAICTGSLQPGERLIQNEVAERLGVSRLPVHEALQQLRQDGFVIETGRRGLVVSPIEPDFVMNLFELRASLDRTAAMSAARSRRSGDEARGLAIIERGRKGLAGSTLTAIASADKAFHSWIYQIAGNPLITSTSLRNWHHVRRAFLMLTEVTPDLARFWEDHTTILNAVIRGNETLAGELCWDHASRAGLAYAAKLRRRAEVAATAAE